jgi:predicted acetyltransferase
MPTAEVRKVKDEEFDGWCDAIDVGFHSPHRRGEGPQRRQWIALDRCWGAFADGRPVGTFRGLELELTVPGGGCVPVDGISSVTVAASHRRQGLLSRMMAAELAEAAERGEPMAVLIAAEWPIYGRFGFGSAADSADWSLDARAAQFTVELPGTVELVDRATARAQAPVVYDRFRRLHPGCVDRVGSRWDMLLELIRPEGKEESKADLFALCRDQGGTVVGFARYRIQDHYTRQRPDSKITVDDLFAVDPFHEARLWKFLADHDWVTEVTTGGQLGSPDPLWRELLVDRRAAWSRDAWESQWVRILDPVVALTARTYESAGRIVLRITDKDGYADGTFALEAGPDGAATCAPSTEAAEVTMSVAVLGSIYLGGYPADRYRRLGRIDEHAPGAAARLNAMFRTADTPFNVTIY